MQSCFTALVPEPFLCLNPFTEAKKEFFAKGLGETSKSFTEA